MIFRHPILLGAIICLILAMAQNLSGQATMTDSDSDIAVEGRDPNEIRRGIRMGGEDGKSRTQIRYERIIRKAEPDLTARPDRLNVYIELFKNELLNDNNLFPTELEASWEAETVILEGHVRFEENLKALDNLFHYLGFEKLDNRVEVLPSKELGDQLFSFVKVPQVLAFNAPTEPRETLTEAFLGDQVWLLKRVNDHYLVQTAEGYGGYIAADALHPVNAEDFASYKSGKQALLLRDVMEGEELAAPQGARLKSLSQSDETVELALPQGGVLEVSPGAVEIYTDEIDSRVIAAVNTAKQILGTDYVWGGKSSAGVDCSGLVQSSFKAQGVYLARDAYQQALNGTMVATREFPQGMRLGDLMYFLGSTGKINHTAIYLGDGKFIEAAGSVKYSSLNPEHDIYDERRAERFAFAKRVLQ